MFKYTIRVKVKYSGEETHEVEVEAEDEYSAQDKACEMVEENDLDLDNPEIIDYETKVLKESEIPEDTRCKVTQDMFVRVQ